MLKVFRLWMVFVECHVGSSTKLDVHTCHSFIFELHAMSHNAIMLVNVKTSYSILSQHDSSQLHEHGKPGRLDDFLPILGNISPRAMRQYSMKIWITWGAGAKPLSQRWDWQGHCRHTAWVLRLAWILTGGLCCSVSLFVEVSCNSTIRLGDLGGSAYMLDQCIFDEQHAFWIHPCNE